MANIYLLTLAGQGVQRRPQSIVFFNIFHVFSRIFGGETETPFPSFHERRLSPHTLHGWGLARRQPFHRYMHAPPALNMNFIWFLFLGDGVEKWCPIPSAIHSIAPSIMSVLAQWLNSSAKYNANGIVFHDHFYCKWNVNSSPISQNSLLPSHNLLRPVPGLRI